jgi:thiol-disulfide isomerase/thioredoxin
VQKKNWIIDLSLIIIILVMGVFVYLEFDRMLEFMRGSPEALSPTVTMTPLIIKEPTPLPTPEFDPAQQIDQTAPDFDLVNLDGETVSLSGFRGKPVVVNFWATWCPPCREEMPLIQAFAEQHAEELIVLAVNAGEDESIVRNYVEETGLDLNFLIDSTSSVSSLYRVLGFPTTVFIDEDGILQATHIGELDEPLFVAYLAKVGINE